MKDVRLCYPVLHSSHPKRRISRTKACSTKTFGLAGTISILLALQGVNASIYDDANTANVWDFPTPNWDGGATWPNGTQAIFGGIGEIVEINDNIETTSIAFNASGYTLADADSNGSLRLGIIGNGTLIQNNAATGINTISESIFLVGGGTKTITEAAGGSLVLSGSISEAGGATKLSLARQATGATTFTLSGDNTYTGGTDIANGAVALNINSATAIGTGPLNVVTSTPGPIDNTSGKAITLSNNNTINIPAAAGGLTYGGTNDLSIGSGVVTLGATTITGNQTRTITANGTASLTIAGVTEILADVTPVGRSLTKAGAGTLAITGPSTHTGGTVLSAGTLFLGDKASAGSGQLTLNVGVLSASTNLSGANAIANSWGTTASGTLTIGGTNSIELSGASTSNFNHTFTSNITGGTLKLSGAIALANGSNSITFTLNGSGRTEISGNLSNGAGGATLGKLTYAGTGTLTLSGANSYGDATTTSTTVTSGTVLVNGSITGPASVAIAGILGGSGTVGNVSVTGTLLAGDGVSPSGGLSSGGNISLQNNSQIKLVLGPDFTHSSLIRTGGTWTFDPTGSNQGFSFVDTGAKAGVYDNIISGLAADPGTSSWVILTPGYEGTFTYDGAGGVDLTLTNVPEPSSAALLLSGVSVLALRRRKRN